MIATALHPQFKLNFLPDDSRLKRSVLAYIQEVLHECCGDEGEVSGDRDGRSSSTACPGAAAKEDEDDLFSFMNVTAQHESGAGAVSKELDEHLEAKSTRIQSLADFPMIAEAFVKANSTLPSSAVVKRLFSIAGMILSPKRCSMSDNLFDQ